MVRRKRITITEAEATILIEAAIKGFKASWYTPVTPELEEAKTEETK